MVTQPALFTYCVLDRFPYFTFLLVNNSRHNIAMVYGYQHTYTSLIHKQEKSLESSAGFRRTFHFP